MVSRRTVLKGSAALGAVGAAALLPAGPSAAQEFEYVLSEAKWKEKLSPAEYKILRKKGTERAGTSKLNYETRAGTYACKGCALPLFSSETKYMSGTGWPSFWEPIENAVLTRPDNSFFMRRTEVICRRCGGHLGHVFEDGPAPTGLRYCINGLALDFLPA